MSADNRNHRFTLFLVGFLVLFLELACIRWFAASVMFLQFFTNVVLIASFLGMSCGLLAARQRYDWLTRFPVLTLITILAALFVLAAYTRWQGLAIDVGHQLSSAQEIFFGTEYRNPDVARFVVPIELIAGLFFVLVSLWFVGLGQVLGQAFDAYPNRVLGYTLNIGGSLAGIAGFSALSFAQTPPIVWFLISFTGVAFLLWQRRQLTLPRGYALAGSLVLIGIPVFSVHHPNWFLGSFAGATFLLWQSERFTRLRGLALAGTLAAALIAVLPFNLNGADTETRWSPYYAIVYDKASRDVEANRISHQQIVPFETGGATYSLIYLLQRYSGENPFRDILIIGSGTGNDIAHALRFGVKRIDAVEIDPVIQDLGIRYHVDRPYQDPRVFRHLDDGRHFLRTTDRKYDLIVYGLVDSLILHSSYANLRLESYLFTEEAFADVQRALKPEGLFVMYNLFRQGWIVHRVAAMAERVFGRPPIVLSLPYRKTLGLNDLPGYTMFIVGDNRAIAATFRRRGVFWMNSVPTQNLDIDGFAAQSVARSGFVQPTQWQQIAPTSLIQEPATPLLASDDWPFLYLRGRLIPDLSIRSTLLLGALGLTMVYFFLPRGHAQIDNRMFFLGAGFLLLETKAVVQLALLFGSTWLVNSLVFFTILSLILLGNVYVLKVRDDRLAWHYTALLLLLVANILIPLEIFLGGGIFWRYVTPCALVLGPMFFASVIFARTFRKAVNPDLAFGSNIAGAVMGGFAETLSLVLGFRDLMLVAMLFYVLSAWVPRLPLGSVGSPQQV